MKLNLDTQFSMTAPMEAAIHWIMALNCASPPNAPHPQLPEGVGWKGVSDVIGCSGILSTGGERRMSLGMLQFFAHGQARKGL